MRMCHGSKQNWSVNPNRHKWVGHDVLHTCRMHCLPPACSSVQKRICKSFTVGADVQCANPV